MTKIKLNKYDRTILSIIMIIIIVAIAVAWITSSSLTASQAYKLDLTNIVETGYGNTVDGDNMYWAIYEDEDNSYIRQTLYMNKETFDSLETAVEIFKHLDIYSRDSMNNTHGFILFRDSEGLHLGSIR